MDGPTVATRNKRTEGERDQERRKQEQRRRRTARQREIFVPSKKSHKCYVHSIITPKRIELESTLFIFYKNQVFSAQPGKRDRDNYRQLTTMFLNFQQI